MPPAVPWPLRIVCICVGSILLSLPLSNAGAGEATPKPITEPPPDKLIVTARPYPNRWFYVSRNLRDEKEVIEIEILLKRAKDHGLTGMVLTGNFDRIDQQDTEYFERLGRVKRAADKYGIEIVPIICSVGYGGGVLSHNRNLAEGFEVKDAPFVMQGDTAQLEPDPACKLANGSFETFDGDKAADLRLQEQPGTISFIDDHVAHDGKVSIRCENFDKNQHGHARIVQELPVKPYRLYAVSFWAKTQDFAPTGAFRVQMLTATGRTAAYFQPTVPATSDWKEYSFYFNSREFEQVRLYIGGWGAKAGKFWIDDCKLREVGISNILRRPGAPLTVVHAEDGVVYEEGKDFAEVVDRKLTFKADRPDIPVQRLPGSRIPDGARLKVSWYHGMPVRDHQISVCMSEPEIYKIWADEVKLLHQKIAPGKYLLSMDEIRAAGSCRACKDRKMPLAEMLGDCITRQRSIIREVNPQAEVYIWSDMLDPNHNAVNHYYVAEGDFRGSWKYIPKDMIVVCWYYDKRIESLKHFSEQGFRTLAGAYYDADDLKNVEGWLAALKPTPGVNGILYTTWQNKYALLDAFGDLVGKPEKQ